MFHRFRLTSARVSRGYGWLELDSPIVGRVGQRHAGCGFNQLWVSSCYGTPLADDDRSGCFTPSQSPGQRRYLIDPPTDCRGTAVSASWLLRLRSFPRTLQHCYAPQVFRDDPSSPQGSANQSASSPTGGAGCGTSESSASATASRSSAKSPAYTSSVIAADAWPNIRWTAFTLAPEAIAKDAAACLKSCGVNSRRPTASRAGSNTRIRHFAAATLPHPAP